MTNSLERVSAHSGCEKMGIFLPQEMEDIPPSRHYSTKNLLGVGAKEKTNELLGGWKLQRPPETLNQQQQ